MPRFASTKPFNQMIDVSKISTSAPNNTHTAASHLGCGALRFHIIWTCFQSSGWCYSNGKAYDCVFSPPARCGSLDFPSPWPLSFSPNHSCLPPSSGCSGPRPNCISPAPDAVGHRLDPDTCQRECQIECQKECQIECQSMSGYMLERMPVRMAQYIYICIYVYMYICIYVYMYICIYVYNFASRAALWSSLGYMSETMAE